MRSLVLALVAVVGLSGCTTTEKDVSRDVLIQCEGKNKFLGQLGQFRGGRAVRITRLCADEQESQKAEKAGEKSPDKAAEKK